MAQPDVSKRKLGDRISLTLLTLARLVSTRMFGEFQAERFGVQVGETAGRELAGGLDAKEVPKAIVDCAKECGLGSMKFEPGKGKGERYEPIGLFRVAESAESYGIGKVEKPACNVMRGLIRGALAAAYHQENISVKEVKCAALGEAECVFEANWVPM